MSSQCFFGAWRGTLPCMIEANELEMNIWSMRSYWGWNQTQTKLSVAPRLYWLPPTPTPHPHGGWRGTACIRHLMCFCDMKSKQWILEHGVLNMWLLTSLNCCNFHVMEIWDLICLYLAYFLLDVFNEENESYFSMLKYMKFYVWMAWLCIW